MSQYQPEILYEDNHIIAINKKPSFLVQADKTGDTPLCDIVKSYIKEKYNKPGNVFLGVVHRIDRPVSGVLLFGRTSKATKRLNGLFKTANIQKTYWAVVKNKPPLPEDSLINYLIKDPETNITDCYNEEVENALKAELSYKVLGSLNNYYFVEVRPVTGRSHQIRVQLANIGCPIRGDKKYGYPKRNKDHSISLHARKIQFVHPIRKETVTITATPPSNYWKQFDSIF
ncbi:RNA pseudouridine synthase [Candidatus Amoebophilus asiaticus]|nr:RNA pseudouridine synthase [Candidatus Amoebophilus asiaticus]